MCKGKMARFSLIGYSEYIVFMKSICLHTGLMYYHFWCRFFHFTSLINIPFSKFTLLLKNALNPAFAAWRHRRTSE